MIALSIRWLTLLLIGTDLFMVSPLLPQIAASGHVGVGTAGWMVSAFSLAYIAGGPTLGRVADRYGRHRVPALALAVFAAANLATGLAPDFPLLLGTRALAGLAAAGVTPSVYALVGASAPPGRRATWLSVVTSGLLLALVTGAPAGALLSQVAGWRGVFLTLAAATLAMLLGAVGFPGLIETAAGISLLGAVISSRRSRMARPQPPAQEPGSRRPHEVGR
jgi:predicted MFS family arabinose efflux permease